MSRIVRYDPFYLWNISDLFDRFFEERMTPTWSRWALTPWRPLLGERFFDDNLDIDVYEADDQLVVETALPGVKAEDVYILEENGYLTIRAHSQKDETRRENGWQYYQSRYGAWQRTFPLPVDVRVDKAKAELRHGLLRITLPKAETGKKGKRIKVNAPRLHLPKIGNKNKRIKVR